MERSAFLKYDKMFLRKQKTDAVALKVFLAFIRRHRLRIRAHGEPLKFCVNLINGRPAGDIGVAAMQLLSGMIDDTRDYAISSAFALLLDAKRRKQLIAAKGPSLQPRHSLSPRDPPVPLRPSISWRPPASATRQAQPHEVLC